MMEKRMGKLETMRAELPRAIVHGVADADIAVIGYGANRGPIAEAVDRLGREGIPARFLQLRTLWPFPDADIRDFVRGAQHIFVVENNFSGQLEGLIRRVTGPLPGLRGVRKYDGRPFHPAEIVEPIRLHAGAPLGEHTQVHAS
jgi:pyruvate/2-oxoacid:ferredoxin oxidoreductase alpha subunit